MEAPCLPLHGELPEPAAGPAVVACEGNFDAKLTSHCVQLLTAATMNPIRPSSSSVRPCQLYRLHLNAPPAAEGRSETLTTTKEMSAL